MTLLFNSHIQEYKSWKNITNNKIIVNPKFIKNTKTESSFTIKPNNNKCVLYKSQFNAKPIKHYRRQYNLTKNINLTKSNMSVVGTLDNPTNSVLLENTDTCVNKQYEYIFTNKTCDTDLCKANLVIKPASTIIDNNYSTTTKEYLYKKCKTYQQNLYNFSNNPCTKNKDCSNVVKYNNKKYMVNGPVSSSARISSIKHNICINGNIVCNKAEKIYNDKFIEMKLKKDIDIDNKCNNVLFKENNICTTKPFKSGKKIRILK